MRTVIGALIALYVVTMAVFLISENRRPQATLAWLLVLFAAPGLGLLIYVLFGRDRKAFSKPRTLLMQELRPHALPLLAPLLSRQEDGIARVAGVGPSERKVAMLARHNSRSALTMRNRVAIQQDAAVFYPSLIDDLRAARRSIHLQTFVWAVDDFTDGLRDLLIEKARDGVAVRLLYDPVGSQAGVGRRYVRAMREAGVHMAPTSPRWQLHTISYRNHRKIAVIDGVVGYTGGMNIGREHLDGGRGFTSWRDTQIRVVGEAAAILQAVFLVDWYNAVRENAFAPEHFPQGRDADDPAASEVRDDEVPVQIVPSGPDSQWAAIQQLYALMVASAQRRVCIQSPYFVLDASLAEALRTAALSGVDVRVMLSARPSGNPLPAWAGYTYMADVVRAGVRVFLYEKGYLHAKTISIDSRLCSIGSANIDIRSFSINYELNAVLYSERLARELEEAFARDLEHCSEFDPAEYRRRSALVRFRDSVARLFSPLL